MNIHPLKIQSMRIKKKLVLFAALFYWISATQAQITVDVANERPMIEARLQEYSKYLLDGDSVSIAAMYAIDGTIGCKKDLRYFLQRVVGSGVA